MGLKRDILIGMAVAGVLLLIIAAVVGLVLLLLKAVGILLLLAGVFLIVLFPDIGEFQPHRMSKTGIVLGAILVALGVLLLVM
ncbi:MAG: hypothetical protein QW548_00230 [Candidatus Aenigmatarchaeota archaeon]